MNYLKLLAITLMTISMQSFACDNPKNCSKQCAAYSGTTATCKSGDSCYCTNSNGDKCYPPSDSHPKDPTCKN